MGVLSILLALLAGFLCLLGFVTAIVPVLGTVMAFGAPVAALIGLTVGGLGWSRARERRRPVDVYVVGTVMNVFALIPALLVAFTCGVCNAMFSSGPVTFQRHFQVGNWQLSDAGLPLDPFAPPSDAPAPDQPGQAPDATPMEQRNDRGEATPPPLPAGPRTPPPAPE